MKQLCNKAQAYAAFYRCLETDEKSSIFAMRLGKEGYPNTLSVPTPYQVYTWSIPILGNAIWMGKIREGEGAANCMY